jgi:hypothetical protein
MAIVCFLFADFSNTQTATHKMLLNLPPELLCYVGEFLNIMDYWRLRRTCKTLAALPPRRVPANLYDDVWYVLFSNVGYAHLNRSPAYKRLVELVFGKRCTELQNLTDNNTKTPICFTGPTLVSEHEQFYVYDAFGGSLYDWSYKARCAILHLDQYRFTRNEKRDVIDTAKRCCRSTCYYKSCSVCGHSGRFLSPCIDFVCDFCKFDQQQKHEQEKQEKEKEERKRRVALDPVRYALTSPLPVVKRRKY